jgi:(4S)-4-hydroxy-5-phosphonooxypentane-2,3-dione isomerase
MFMYVVTVEFDIASAYQAKFMQAMISNAQMSLAKERGCRQFDVCASMKHSEQIFLYECYDSEEAFNLHLASPHFIAFNALTTPWVVGKTVRTYRRNYPQT